MIEVPMTKDIRDYEPKVIGIFTARQLVCICIASAYGIPLAFLLPIEDITLRITVAVLLMAPVIICGWVKAYEMPLETFVRRALLTSVFRPAIREYRSNTCNSYKGTPKRAEKKKKKMKKSRKYPARL